MCNLLEVVLHTEFKLVVFFTSIFDCIVSVRLQIASKCIFNTEYYTVKNIGITSTLTSISCFAF